MISDGSYFMVGIMGEVYPIKADKFNRSYEKTDGVLTKDYSYCPTVRNKASGEVKEIADYIKPCVALGEVNIHAKPLEKIQKFYGLEYRRLYIWQTGGLYRCSVRGY